MTKRERIYKDTVDTRKTRSISIRMTESLAQEIDDKIKLSGKTRNDFICEACQNCQIVIIPEGQQILQAIQESRNILREIRHIEGTKEINVLLGEVVIRVKNILEEQSKAPLN